MKPEEFIHHLVAVARAIGMQAGAGEMETAGMIVSYLAAHPKKIPLFCGGYESVSDWPDFVEGGCLTWHAENGQIVHPSEARATRAASQDTAS